MREFTCVVCGAKGIDRSRTGTKIYCSEKCREKHRADNLTTCKYNVGVCCAVRRCSACGWNPEVEKRRKQKLLSKHGRRP